MNRPQGANPRARHRKLWKLYVFLAVLCAVLAAYLFTDLKSWLTASRLVELRESIRDAGIWGIAAYLGVYVAFVSLGLPNLPFQLAAGAIYGLGKAYLLMYPGVVLGACAAFALARLLGREAIEELLGNRMLGVNRRIEEGGFRYLLILRMIPLVPFNAINYGSGISRLSFAKYFAATALGSPALTFAHVAIGHATVNADLLAPRSWLQPDVWLPLAASFFVLGASLVAGRWLRRRGGNRGGITHAHPIGDDREKQAG